MKTKFIHWTIVSFGLLVWCLFPALNCAGQTRSATVILLVHPAEATVFVDGAPMRLGTWHNIAPGTHPCQISARSYIRKDTILQLQPGDSIKFKVALEHTPAYLDYERDCRSYERRKTLAVWPLFPVPLLLGPAVALHYRTRLKMKTLVNDAQDALDHYSQTIAAAELTVYHDKYNAAKAEYDKVYKRLLWRDLGVGIAAVAFSGLAIRSLVHIRKVGKPVYVEPGEPTGMKLELGPGSACPLCLQASLQF